MAQDYYLQFENLKYLKSEINRFIENINELDSLYPSMIEISHRDGMPVEMFRKMMAHNVKRWHALMHNLNTKIETEDIPWIKSLEDGFEAVLSTSGNAAMPASGSAATTLSAQTSSAPAPSSVSSVSHLSSNPAQSVKNSIAEEFRSGSRRVKNIATATTLSASSDSGRNENQRDMHADYVAAFIANQNQR